MKEAVATVLPRWLHAEPDSLVALIGRGSRGPGAFWFPVVNLIWLAWMVGAPWVFAPGDVRVLVLTFASVAVFLVLYQRAWFGSRSRLGLHTLGIALLGLAMVAVNSSWSYVIYAGSLIPLWTRGWRAVLWLVALLAAFRVVALASGFFTPLLTVSCIVMTSVVALLNAGMRMNAERDAELRLSQEEVRRLAVAAERERIGRDLHDLLGHTLSLVAVKAELARRLLDRDASKAATELADIERVSRQALAEVREAVTGIRATALAAELASARLMLASDNTAFVVDGTDATLAADAEATLALALREAVTNIHRHAHATRVDALLAVDGHAVTLTITDNGRGGVAKRGTGLAGMEERLAALGGTLVVESAPGCGTVLRMQIPRRSTERDEAPA